MIVRCSLIQKDGAAQHLLLSAVVQQMDRLEDSKYHDLFWMDSPLFLSSTPSRSSMIMLSFKDFVSFLLLRRGFSSSRLIPSYICNMGAPLSCSFRCIM